ncbi:unnamed protein product [Linum tenue]|uniref:non-specific serine/threonine protein kinase n=1 Tax=Linum tenue TaxID=586396 RepID=A0AAV0MAF3_9ROSI|nr:unnamed protein product [Linum tenue]
MMGFSEWLMNFPSKQRHFSCENSRGTSLGCETYLHFPGVRKEFAVSNSKPSSSAETIPTTPRTEGEILHATNLKRYTFSDLKLATGNFRPDSLLGKGGFGCVFKGSVDENSFTAVRPGTGMPVAVKRLNQESCQSDQELLAEIKYLGLLFHPNLVKMVGYCIEEEHWFLVHEFIPMGSLENHLFRRTSHFQTLSWNLRMKIAVDAAKGLAFLHSSKDEVAFAEFSTSNILLDSSYNAKLSDIGLIMKNPVERMNPWDTRISAPFDGGAPEYIATGLRTSKSDVYRFEVVLLEIISGRRELDRNKQLRERFLVEWARPYLSNKKKIFHVMDVRIQGQYNVKCALKVAALALICLSADPRCRPNMEQVVRSLEQIYHSSSSSR